MFDTGLNLFLQSFQSEWLTILMLIVSLLGSEQFLMIAAGFIFFRGSFQKSSLLLQILFWTLLLTSILKNLLGLPRPTDVDPAVQLLYPEALRKIAEPERSFGFPSGHLSATTAFSGALFFLFRKKIPWYIPALAISLMAVSRMYLGRHFLIDVIGGFALGVAVIAIAFDPWLYIRQPKSTLTAAWFIAVPILCNFIPQSEPSDCGRLLGANSVLYLVLRGGIVKDGDDRYGLLRFAAGILLFTAAAWLAVSWAAHPNRWIQLAASLLPSFLFFVPALFPLKKTT